MSSASNLTGPLGHQLSVREEQIVRLLLRGKRNSEIARELSLSAKTVKGYMTTLMAKLNVRNRLEAVLAAQRLEPTASRAPLTDEDSLQRQGCARLIGRTGDIARHPKGWWAFRIATEPKIARADFAPP